MKKTDALIILDGFGLSDKKEGNAVFAQGTPYIRSLMRDYPFVKLNASGLSVGLPENVMGNSEVGHLNLGAGRIVYQDITRIDKAIDDGEFFENEAFKKAIDNCLKHGSVLHLSGLCSDGSVHSSLKHLFALLTLAKRHNVPVALHFIADGRDVAPDSAIKFCRKIGEEMKRIGVGKIVTVSGRYYIMDRDKNWDRLKLGYDAVVRGAGLNAASAEEAIKKSYESGVTDEFIIPTVIDGYEGLKQNDSFIFFNFRSDRAREITSAIIDPDFDKFQTAKVGVTYVGMTRYDETFTGLYTAFPPKTIENGLGEWLSRNNIIQARVAETEKYAHVTFFFNGGVEVPNAGERRTLVPSPKVATYDLKPEMSAFEVADKAVTAADEGADVLIVNFANCDMVGHTGVFDATVKAVTAVETALKKVVDRVLSSGGTALVTADHGNAEQMIADGGGPMTAHTTNPVPFILVGEKFKGVKLREGGALCDVAPTLLKVMGIEPPAEMTGKALF